MTLTLEQTKNGKPLILHHNYKYRESHCLKNGERAWRCLGRNCGATLKTNAEATRLVTLSLSPAPTPPAASPSTPATPASASTPVASSAQSAATPALSSDAELPASPATSTGASIPVVCLDSASAAEVADLVAENKVLQDRLLQLEEQFKHVLNHSIESDTRLMQYTTQVFVASTPRVDLPVRVSATDCGVQCDLPINCGDQRCAETRDLVASLRTTIEVLEAELKMWVYGRIATYVTCSCSSNNCRKQIHGPIRPKRGYGKLHSSDRHLSAIMRAQRAGHTSIIGVCKPGAGLLHIAPSHAPPENHCYVLIAGTNDLAAGRQDIVIQHMEEVIKSCRISSNLLVSPLPPRYDLPPDSPIHEAIALANSYVSELCERYEGVAMMDISVLGREHFTPHGLHLTTTGKSLLAGVIVKELTSLPRHRFGTTAPTAPPRSPSASPTPPTPTAQHRYVEAAKGMSVRP
ncbi:hypothetical protein J6590_072032 [Homalodisca vitripennis]|nr:hypothetical protein J6590_072032 [Homalodisca vitripennis]